MAAFDVTAERGRRPIAPAALTMLMVVGSVAMWTVVPIAGLWIASQLSDSFTQMGVVSLLAVVVGIPAAMACAGKLLARIDRLHTHVTGSTEGRVVPAPRRSLGDSPSVRMTRLDKIMIASVLVAVTAMAVWFFAVAGSSVPA